MEWTWSNKCTAELMRKFGTEWYGTLVITCGRPSTKVGGYPVKDAACKED